MAWWEAGLLDPREGETEEPSHVGRWRRQKAPEEPQAAVEKEVEDDKIDGYKLQRDATLTAIPQSGTSQRAVPLHQRQLGMHSAQGMEAFEANEVSDDELEAEHQKAVASTIILQQHEKKLPCAQGRQLGHWKDGHHCLAKVKRVNWAGGSSKLVGELHTVSCVAGSRTPVNLKPSCGSSESILHNLGPESSTYVADMCCDVPNLGGSVVSDCGDTRPANGTPGYGLGVGDTKKMFSWRSEGTISGTQPVCQPLPLSAPDIDLESVVDVCISCVVSDARGPPIEGDPSVVTSMTNDSLIDDGLTTGEPQACANLSLGGSIRSGIAYTYDGGDNGWNEPPSLSMSASLNVIGASAI